jgi:glutamate-ammonia-ligase adenylyltransferase
LRSAFDQVREAVICAPRDAAALRSEIVSMRQRVQQAHTVPTDSFDVKHSPGGMVDAEFVVQYLVLLHAAKHPELRPNVGNIALLQRAEQAGLLQPGMGQRAADAYRRLRQLQHTSRLNEDSTQLGLEEVKDQQQAISQLWAHVLGER